MSTQPRNGYHCTIQVVPDSAIGDAITIGRMYVAPGNADDRQTGIALVWAGDSEPRIGIHGLWPPQSIEWLRDVLGEFADDAWIAHVESSLKVFVKSLARQGMYLRSRAEVREFAGQFGTRIRITPPLEIHFLGGAYETSIHPGWSGWGWERDMRAVAIADLARLRPDVRWAGVGVASGARDEAEVTA